MELETLSFFKVHVFRHGHHLLPDVGPCPNTVLPPLWIVLPIAAGGSPEPGLPLYPLTPVEISIPFLDISNRTYSRFCSTHSILTRHIIRDNFLSESPQWPDIESLYRGSTSILR